MDKILKIVSISLILLILIISAWYVLHGSIVFHTDIARDFLLIEEIVKHKPLTLIGPRSGGIPGVFHGPLWLYLNVLAFILGNGNPVVVGWFWLVLLIANLLVVYFVAQKLFKNKLISIYSVLLVAAATITDARSLFNPWGAVMITPLFFYFYWRYTINLKLINLIISFIFLGAIIQFQMAFGIPILILTLIHFLYLVRKNKKFFHSFAFLLLIIPLSTFILFDLKHQFLQSKAVIDFITGKVNTGKTDASFFNILDDRVKRVFMDVPGFLTYTRWYLFIPLLFILFKAFETVRKKGRSVEKSSYILFLYFYFGFWTITLIFKGQIWGYYYWPFISLIAIFFVSLKNKVDSKLFYLVFICALFLNITNGIRQNVKSEEFLSSDGGSWKFYDKIAKDIYKDASQDFGYYIFSGDQFGYSPRYAMNYNQVKFSNTHSFPFQKKKLVYLIIVTTDNPFLNENWWKVHQVNITNKAIFTKHYHNAVIVEKFELTADEVNIPSDPNIMGATLIFR